MVAVAVEANRERGARCGTGSTVRRMRGGDGWRAGLQGRGSVGCGIGQQQQLAKEQRQRSTNSAVAAIGSGGEQQQRGERRGGGHD